jgi:ABC-2 type transport system ATP-binding protein
VPSILVRQMSRSFGDTLALDRISFEVEEGTFFGCFGPNGAGKSTLLRILTGQLPPTSGTATVANIDVEGNGPAVRERVGIVPEAESPPSYLTAYEYLAFVGRVRKVDDLEERVGRWIDFFDLEASQDVLCKDLSRGTRQKVMLSSAFLHEPPILFLDEPFVNLDPVYQHRLREYLLRLREEGRTIFMCSHILETAQRLCQEMIVLNQGRIVASGSVPQLTAREDLETLFLRLVGEDVHP